MTKAPELEVFFYIHQLFAHLVRIPLLFRVAINITKNLHQRFIPTMWCRPISFATFVRDAIASPRKISQELVVKAGRFKRSAEIFIDRYIVREHLNGVEVLIAE